MRILRRYFLTIVGAIVTLIVAVTLLQSVVLFQQFNLSISRTTHEATSFASATLLEQMKQRGILLARQTGDNLVNPLYQFDMERIYGLLTVARNEEGVLFVQVFDKNLQIVHDGTTTIEKYGKPVLNSKLAQLALDNNTPQVYVGENELQVAYSVRLGDQVIGGYLMGISLDQWHNDLTSMRELLTAMGEESMKRNTYLVALMSLVSIAMGVALSVRVARRMTRPITLLRDYAQRIGQGVDEPPPSLGRQDEISDLAVALGEMSRNLKNSAEEIKYLAFHDKLTGLPNRAKFRELLDLLVDRGKKGDFQFALLFIDADEFKLINDTRGHHAGDAVLQEIARRIIATTRASDLVVTAGQGENDCIAARLGGDEFIVLLPNVGDEAIAGETAERILTQFAEPIFYEGHELHIGASIGIAIFPRDGVTPSELVRNADTAMYVAKNAGKFTYRHFETSMRHYGA